MNMTGDESNTVKIMVMDHVEGIAKLFLSILFEIILTQKNIFF